MPDAVRTVGRYEVMRRLGRGGMAVVHLARQTDLDRLVALKELNALDAEEHSTARRFLQESRLAGSLAHPSIVHVYDYFEYEGTPFIAMEYLAGGTLRPYVGHMTFAQIAGVLEAMLSALTHAEQQGIVHRDLKPENVLVAPDGRVKIADFGIAKAINRVNPSALMTATGMAVGTPAYMAPEQAMAGQIGPWTDLYAVGCMAFELFTSAVPFAEADTPMAMLLRRINEPTPQAVAVNEAVPADLSDWIDRLLIKEPAARTQSADDASDELEDIVIGLVGARWRRSARLPASVAAGAAVDPLTRPEVPPRPPSEGGSNPEAQPGPATGPGTSTGVVTPAGAGAIPGPYTPPPDAALPDASTPDPDAAIPDTIPGPYTPPPGDAIADDDFITFERFPETPPEATSSVPIEPAAPDPVPAASTDPAPAAAMPVEDDDAPATGDFETYIPPPPPRPPAADASLDLHDPEPASRPSPTGAVSALSSPHELAPTHAPSVARPAPSETGRARRELRPRRPVVVAGAVLGACALAGLIALVTSSKDDPAPKTPVRRSAQLASGPLRLQAPAGWSRSRRPVAVPGLELRDAASAASGDSAGAGSVIVGLAGSAAENPALLPASFVDGLGLPQGATPPRSEVALGGRGLHAYRYTDLSPRGLARSLTVYASPTSEGVATVACVRPSARDAGFDATCARAAGTLTAGAAKAFPLGPSAAYATAVNGTFDGLAPRLERGRGDLRQATTAKGQATAAGSLAAAYRGASGALAGLDLSPADRSGHRALLATLRAASAGFGSVSRAAATASSRRYAIAAGRTERAERAIGAALASLRDGGYRALLTAKLQPSALPPLRRPRRRRVIRRPAPTATPAPTARPQPTAQPRPQPTAIPRPQPIPRPKPKPTPIPIP